jgi:hypothetical protein
MRATLPAHLTLLDFITLKISGGVQTMELLILQFSPGSRHFILPESKYFPKHQVVKHPNMCSSFNMRDQVPRPCKKKQVKL